MNAPRIAFRADASREIGTGHLRRCLALADALRAGGRESVFVTRDLGAHSREMVLRAGHDCLLLPAPDAPYAPPPGAPPHAAWAAVDQLRDARETVAALAETGAEGIVVDHYAFDRGWADAVWDRHEVVAAIDDLGDRPLRARLLVDHNHNADPEAKHALSPGTRLLAGPRYALIDAAYARAPRYEFHATVASMGIFLGGVDALALSGPVAGALRAAGFAGGLELVTTSANPALAALRGLAGDAGATLSVDQPNLAAFFARHDVQIGAAGGATWERCCIGAPTLACIVAGNQEEVLGPLSALDVVEIVDGAPGAGRIAEAALALAADPDRRHALSVNAQALVDGRGADRVAREILAL